MIQSLGRSAPVEEDGAVHRFQRHVLGYHGCRKPFGTRLLMGECSVVNWHESSNAWDWLGRGIYFWEHAPERAFDWARQQAAAKGGEPEVIGAVIQLGRCFDLTDRRFTAMLGDTHRVLSETMSAQGARLPRNRGPDRRNRQLDCLVINACLDLQATERFQTVRSAFWEGEPAYEGSMFMKESHIQVAVRDRTCILGVFRPYLNDHG